MSDRERERLNKILREAGRLGPEEREAYLDEACAGDDELRNEVESLLTDDRSTTEILREFEETETLPPDPEVPRKVGPYRILEKIKEGGMGVVYLAEQETPLRRRVALKLIKWGMDTKAVVARFEAERQALALMNHPNVAKVFDAGATEQGRPYFAMEFVKGVPISEHCDRYRLGLVERLELFEQICDGVQHAHQKGLIHRDLKPSNILVHYENERATPKIIDFGVAKALDRPLTERTIFTVRGQLIGTPEYMSPEQAELTAQDIDTRSDIYSLGVLLYELLTGALPFDRRELREAGFDHMLRMIRDSDPPKPSTRLLTLFTSNPAASSEAARRRRIDPRTLVRRLRGDLDWITMRCLEKDRSRRYVSASDLADDLRRHLEDRPVLAGPPGLAYLAGKLWKRHRGRIVAAGLITVILVVSLVTATALTVSRLRLQDELNHRIAGELIEEARLLGPEHRSDAWNRLERAAALDGESERVRLQRLRLLRLDRRYEDAIAEAQAVLEAQPGSGVAAAMLAGLLLRDDPEASERYRAQAEASLERPELLQALATGVDDNARAIALLTESLEEQPWNFEALWQRAVRRYNTGDLDGAMEDVELMTRVRRDLALVWAFHGAILIRQSQGLQESERSRALEKARSSLDEAIDRNDGYWIAYFNRALAHKRLEEYESAVADLDRAIELHPGSADLHNERALALADLELLDEALGDFDEAIRLGRDTVDARWDRASTRFAAGDYAGTAEDFGVVLDKLPSDSPDRPFVFTLRGLAHLLAGEHDAARADLEEAIRLDPGFALPYSFLSRLSRRENRSADALTHSGRAVALEPANPNFRLDRGIAYWILGDSESAVADLTAFAEENPDAGGSWIRIWIWAIESASGDPASARAHLDTASTANDPLLQEVVRVIRDETAAAEALDSAGTPKDRLKVLFSLGLWAAVNGDDEQASEWFTEVTGLGLRSDHEHDLAEWRLGRFGG